MAHARQCTECGAGMNEGYLIEAGITYYCSDPCLHKHMTPAEYNERYADGDGDCYWTEWEENETEGEDQ